jgi:hypothetical protein
MDLPSRILSKGKVLRFRSLGSASALVFVILQFPCPAASSQPLLQGGGGYQSLSTRQKKLISDYTASLKQKANLAADPEQMYDRLPQSYRSTFDAITNALEKTVLSGKPGDYAGSALDLVTLVEGIAGEVDGKRPDEQFRIFVALRPGALTDLNHSTQFRRSYNNTIYHRGYPLSYRTAGLPSIHISLTEDGRQGDIEVDYRTSTFPQAFIDGRVAGAIMDVRAGDNYFRHSHHWSGLDPWWENMVDVAEETAHAGQGIANSPVFPAEPPEKASDLSGAVEQFLKVWLVLQEPEVAVAYFDDDALFCSGSPANAAPPVRRMSLYRELQLVNQATGKMDSVSEAVLSAPSRVSPSNPDSAPAPPYEGFKVPDAEISTLLCSPPQQEKRQDVYVVRFRLSIPRRWEVGVRQYWRQDDGTWKIVALRVDPDLNPVMPPVAKLPSYASGPEADTVSGDPEMITAALQFFQNWLIFQNIEGALAVLAPSAYQCFSHGKGTIASVRAATTAAFREAARATSTGHSTMSLDKVMVATPPWAPQEKLVDHLYSAAFSVVQPTSSLVDELRCSPAPHRGPAYVTSFALPGGEQTGATLLSVWEQVDQDWTITSMSLLDP